MDWFSNWWAELALYEKILWPIAVPFTLLTILQVLMEIMGFGHDSDMNADASGIDGSVSTDGNIGHEGAGGMHLFSVKGVIIFFCSFSWIGLAGYGAGLGAFFSSLIGAVFGVGFMFLFAWIFYSLNKLTETGNVQIKNALYQRADVYLKIPAHRSGKGKVNTQVQEMLREFSALTDGEEIPTGASVQIVDILDQETVLVAKE